MSPQEQMHTKLTQLGLPYHEIKCYGSQIMVTAIGLETAQRWHTVLGKFCRKVRSGETVLYNQVNRGTCLNPTVHKAYNVWGTV